MKIVFAADSYKGSLSSYDVNGILEEEAKKIFGSPEFVSIPIADGGEGTLEAILDGGGKRDFEKIHLNVTGPLGGNVSCFYIKRDNIAVIEMAQSSGLTLIREEQRNPLRATSKGLGELIAHALSNGCSDITIGVGGSATNDGGMGAMTALGFRFLDKSGKELYGCGSNLINVSEIDDSSAMEEIKGVSFTIMCDVTNVLTGPDGAARVYLAQKGATASVINLLEAGMQSYERVLQNYADRYKKNIDVHTHKSYGAAGGAGAALSVFLNGKIKSGIDVLLDLCGFDRIISDADIVVTGEGRTDYQSTCGKVICGIAKRCKGKNIPLFVLSGSIDEGAEVLYEIGVTSMEAAVCKVTDINDAMYNAEVYLRAAAVRLFRTIERFF